MVKQIVTRYCIARKYGKKKNATYESPRIYLSTKLTGDSSFPLKEKDRICVRIVKNRLVVEKLRRR
ncbi:MAG: hypothetical protein QXF26_05135 [Candidatus Bathyarchaeia archaeon]